MFGRHFVSDIVFAGLITIAVIMALYRILIAPFARNDARVERGIERVATALHRMVGSAGVPGGAAEGAPPMPRWPASAPRRHA
jgi:hypothetical protein